MRLALSDAPRGAARHRLARDRRPVVIPRSPPVHLPALRLERAMRDLYGVQPVGLPDPRPWLDPRSLARPGERDALRIPADRGRGAAPDPGRAGPCRHHRARPLPLHRQRRDGRAARGAAGLCAQGRRGADGGAPRSSVARGSSVVSRATARWPMPGPLPGRSKPRWHGRRRRAPCCCAASWPSWSGCRTTSTMSARSAMTPACSRIHARCTLQREDVLVRG